MERLCDVLNGMPFAEHLGIEITAAADGTASGRLEFGPEHSSVPGERIGHGGVAYALADTIGGAAVISLEGRPTPTIDMRIDYLAPARTDLFAEAVVRRRGGSVAVADVEVVDENDRAVATARGVYKTGGGDGETPWTHDTDGTDTK